MIETYLVLRHEPLFLAFLFDGRTTGAFFNLHRCVFDPESLLQRAHASGQYILPVRAIGDCRVQGDHRFLSRERPGMRVMDI